MLLFSAFKFGYIIAELGARARGPIDKRFGKPTNAKNVGFGFDVTVRLSVRTYVRPSM